MTQKINTSNEETVEMTAEHEAIVTAHTSQDLRNAVLIVSLIANLAIFTAWVAIQVTSRYDAQLAGFLFN